MAGVNLTNLIQVTADSPSGSRKAGRWQAVRDGDGTVVVWHYGTAMFRYFPDRRLAVPISGGWGSMSDRQGVGKLLRGAGCRNAISFRELYADGWQASAGAVLVPEDRVGAELAGVLLAGEPIATAARVERIRTTALAAVA
jgi:hypothetical protein